MVNELAGKVAIVTGGASGIGAGIVEKFLAEGARVVIADVERDRGEDLAATLGADAAFRLTDVSDPDQVGALVTGAVETFGGLDVMVNNAGVSSKMHRSFLDDDLADFHRVMSVNVLGVMAGTRDAARYMATRGGGSIVNVSSIGGIQAGGGVMSYRASKAAVIQFTQSAAIELAYYDIRVNTIAPGNIPTPLLASSNSEKDARRAAAVRAGDSRADASRPPAEAGGHTRGRRGGRAISGRRPVQVRDRDRPASRRRDRHRQSNPASRRQGKLNQSLDLIRIRALTGQVTTARAARSDRASTTQEAILTAAERLFAEHGVFAVSNRQVSEAAGQGNNAAVGYHFGTKTDLVRAIEQRHRVAIEQLRESMVAETLQSGAGDDMRSWVACLVRPLTDHLAALGNPTWYARFAAQVMTDPAYYNIVVKDALTSESLVQVIDGINRCLPELPIEVRVERNLMARNLLMHTCAERERAMAAGASVPGSSWQAAGSGLIDAVVGLWLAPVTPHE